MYLSDSILQRQARAQVTEEMRKVIRDDLLEAKLIPPFGIGCQRLIPDVGYLEVRFQIDKMSQNTANGTKQTLTKDNISIVHQGVSAFTKKGCQSYDGQEHLLDVIICATGFDTSFRPRFPIIGRDGSNLQDVWLGQPKSYLGIAAAGFPNFLMFLGPNSPTANGPTLSAIGKSPKHRCLDAKQHANACWKLS